MNLGKIILIAALFFIVFGLTVNSYARRGSGNDYYAAPDLLSPRTQNIDLTSKDILEFRWRQVDLTRTDHYEFKIYKGYNTWEANLIFKQLLPRTTPPFTLSKEQFEVGQVYTWTLRQVYLGGEKTEYASSSFKVIKK